MLDETDRHILELLQHDARATNAAVGAAVGLSAPSVYERIRKLEERGVIQGYHAQLNPAALGKSLTAFIRLTIAYDEKHATGLRALSRDPDVLECYSVAGEDCLIVKTHAGGPGELEALINRIRSQLTVLRSVTMIALSAIKEDGELNVGAPPAPPKPAKLAKPRRARRARVSPAARA